MLSPQSGFISSEVHVTESIRFTVASRTFELLHNMTNPQVTNATVEWIARGAGDKFLVLLDVRFATKAHTLLGQPEVGMDLMPGGGGGQYLPRLIGRGRAWNNIELDRHYYGGCGGNGFD